MGAIVDVIVIGKGGIAVIETRYPRCVMRNITNSRQLTQKYRLIIPNEESEESYYCFLVDNGIALASSNFRARMDSDEAFAERMRRRSVTLASAAAQAKLRAAR